MSLLLDTIQQGNESKRRPRLTGKGFFKDAYSVMNAWAANHGACLRP